jgi:hypothetical protein
MDGVVFITRGGQRGGQPGDQAGMMAQLKGRLVVDGEGCLRVGLRGSDLRGSDLRGGDLPVWPPGYSLRTEGGETLVLDPRGHPVARAGGGVNAGGDQIARAGSMGGYEDLRHELGVPGKCKGPFWIITPPVNGGG